VIPVGGLDDEGRKYALEMQLQGLNTGEVDLDRIVEMTTRFTPADIQYLFQQVAQFAFEKEYDSGQEYRVTTDTFIQIMPKVRPSLTDDIIVEFQRDSIAYTRT
jgi:SpoVK/Ycf46/Vps4 family AAA+-type ATPase